MVRALQSEGSDQRGSFEGKGVARSEMLRAIRCEGKRTMEAAKHFQAPAALRGGGFWFHDSGLPRDQGVKRFGWDDAATTNANSTKASSGDMRIDR